MHRFIDLKKRDHDYIFLFDKTVWCYIYSYTHIQRGITYAKYSKLSVPLVPF